MAENTRKRSQTKEKLKSALIELCEEKSYYGLGYLRESRTLQKHLLPLL